MTHRATITMVPANIRIIEGADLRPGDPVVAHLTKSAERLNGIVGKLTWSLIRDPLTPEQRARKERALDEVRTAYRLAEAKRETAQSVVDAYDRARGTLR